MSMSTIEMLERAAQALGDLVAEEVVFVGGATVALWSTDPAAGGFRPTDDVDVIVEIASLNDYYGFEDRLRELGFANDEGGVICRFRHSGQSLILDAMPTEAASSASTTAGRGRRSRTRSRWSSRPTRSSAPCLRRICSPPSSRRSGHAATGTSFGVTTSRT